MQRLSSGRWLVRRLEGLLGWIDRHRTLSDELDAATASTDQSGSLDARQRLVESLGDGLEQIDALLNHLSSNDSAIRELAGNRLRAQLNDAPHALGAMRAILDSAHRGLQWPTGRIPQRRDLENSLPDDTGRTTSPCSRSTQADPSDRDRVAFELLRSGLSLQEVRRCPELQSAQPQEKRRRQKIADQRSIPPEGRGDQEQQLHAPLPHRADRFEDWKAAESSLRDLLELLHECGRDDTISRWDNESPVVQTPGGWTKKELVKAALISEGTFDKIRSDAGLQSAKRGGKGARRRFTPEELSALIRAAQSSRFPKRIKAAEEWAELRLQSKRE